jgi:hypothetical protein
MSSGGGPDPLDPPLIYATANISYCFIILLFVTPLVQCFAPPMYFRTRDACSNVIKLINMMT